MLPHDDPRGLQAASSGRYRRMPIRWRHALPPWAPSPPSTPTPSTRATIVRSRSRSTASSPSSPRIAAYAYKHSIGQPFMYPKNRPRTYVGNYLHMMFGNAMRRVRARSGRAASARGPALHPARGSRAELLDVQRRASSAPRWSTSSAAISAAINALWGPLPRRRQPAGHRDAWRPSSDEGMTGARVRREAPRAKDDASRLMGFGHRVYKNFDPRA